MRKDIAIIAATMLVCVFMIGAAAGLVDKDVFRPTALMVH